MKKHLHACSRRSRPRCVDVREDFLPSLFFFGCLWTFVSSTDKKKAKKREKPAPLLHKQRERERGKETEEGRFMNFLILLLLLLWRKLTAIMTPGREKRRRGEKKMKIDTTLSRLSWAVSTSRLSSSFSSLDFFPSLDFSLLFQQFLSLPPPYQEKNNSSYASVFFSLSFFLCCLSKEIRRQWGVEFFFFFFFIAIAQKRQGEEEEEVNQSIRHVLLVLLLLPFVFCLLFAFSSMALEAASDLLVTFFSLSLSLAALLLLLALCSTTRCEEKGEMS